MSNIEQNLQNILSSRYGKDVRQAIHDSIHDCYEDGKAGSTDLVAREQIANLVANAGSTEKDSELVDIRVGVNGKTYKSAGEAVREMDNRRLSYGGDVGDPTGDPIDDELSIGQLDPHKRYLIWRNAINAMVDIDDDLRSILGSYLFVYLSTPIYASPIVHRYDESGYVLIMPIYAEAGNDKRFILGYWDRTHVLSYLGEIPRWDNTLSVPYYAADAKITGDILDTLNMVSGKFVYDGHIGSNGNLFNNPPGFKATSFIKIPKNVTNLLVIPYFMYEECICFYDDNQQLVSSFNKNSEGFTIINEDPSILLLDRNPLWTYFRMSEHKSNEKKVKLYVRTDGQGYSENLIVRPELSGVQYVSRWGTPQSVSVDFFETYIKLSNVASSTSRHGGIQTQSFLPSTPIKNPILFVDLKINSGVIDLYIAGKRKETGAEHYVYMKRYRETTKETINVDLSFYDVYKNLDLNSKVYFILSSSTLKAFDIEVYTFQYLFDEFNGSSLPGNTLTDTINNIQNELNKKANADSIKPGTDENVLISPNGNKFIATITDDGIVSYIPIVPNKTLFIGNSLLVGWKTFGMCAKDSSHDYYHYMTDWIKKEKSSATFNKLSGTEFEGATSDLEATNWMTNTLRGQLSNDIDLVIIQLSDNVNTEEKLSTFRSTCIQLIRYIRSICTKARIAWVSAWYYTSEKQSIIQSACENTGSTFIDITDIASSSDNRGSIGDEIHKDDGSTVIVDSSGVASHPGNKGMRLIANRILYSLSISNTNESYDESYDD